MTTLAPDDSGPVAGPARGEEAEPARGDEAGPARRKEVRPAPGQEPPPLFNVRAHSRASRFAVISLRGLGALNVLYLGVALAGDFVNGTQAAPPLAVAAGLAVFTAVPLAIALLLELRAAATLTVAADALTLTLRGERIEIPVASVTCVRPLKLPVPEPGLLLELGSGRTFERVLGTRESRALFCSLAAHLCHDDSAMLEYSDALPRKRRWLMPLLKLAALPLLMSVVIFRLHQMVVYGGPFGQYHVMGVGPYLASFFMRWLGIAGTFAVLFGVLHLVTEAAIYGLTWQLRYRASAVRRVAEALSSIVYFGGVPGYVAVRLLFD